jgi:hypothetical protein
MIISGIFSIVFSMPACDLVPTVEQSARDNDVTILAIAPRQIAEAAEAALALAPEVDCDDRQKLVSNVVNLWIREGTVFVERPHQVGDIVARPFGKVLLRVADPVIDLTVHTANQTITIPNGRKLVLAAGPIKLDVYAGDRLICSVSHVVKADQVDTLTCSGP